MDKQKILSFTVLTPYGQLLYFLLHNILPQCNPPILCLLIVHVHCTKNQILEFREMKLCGLVPSSYIHVSVTNPGNK